MGMIWVRICVKEIIRKTSQMLGAKASLGLVHVMYVMFCNVM